MNASAPATHVPVSPVQPAHELHALYSGNVNRIQEELASFKDDGRFSPGKHTVLFAQPGDSPDLPLTQNAIGSMFYPHTANLFRRVMISTGLQLFDHHWSMQFLIHLQRSLRSDGELLVPLGDARSALRKKHLTADSLRSNFPSALVDASDRMAIVRSGNAPESNASILNWHFRNFGQLAALNSRIATMPEPLDRHAIERALTSVLLQPDDLDQLMAAAEYTRSFEARGRVAHESRIASESYYMNGVRYKAPLVSHIIRTHLGHRSSLHMLDHGSGPGYLLAELFFDQALSIDRAVCCDTWFANALHIRAMCSDHWACFGDRMRFSPSAAQDFHYDTQYDVILFIGSFLYVPQPQRAAALERAWDALRQGGILVIHENIQSPSFERDYNMMFTVHELDGMLSHFGDIHRYHSSATIALSRDEAGERSVFRVIQKP
jgi:SAM-dependent methyltransferase